MPNIVDRFGQLVDDAISKPELARRLLLLGYRAKDVQLLLAPEKELTPARQYAAQIAMDAMIAPRSGRRWSISLCPVNCCTPSTCCRCLPKPPPVT